MFALRGILFPQAQELDSPIDINEASNGIKT